MTGPSVRGLGIEQADHRLAEQGVGREPVEERLKLDQSQRLVDRCPARHHVGRGERDHDDGHDQRPHDQEEQPHAQRAQGRGRRRAEDHREQHRCGEPHAAIGDGDGEEGDAARHLDAARRNAEQQQAGAEHDQPQRHQRDGQCGERAQELPEQQRVAIDRLRQDARQRPAIELAVDRVEAQADRQQRNREAQRRREGKRHAARGRGENAQEQERVGFRHVAQLGERRRDRERAEGDHEQHQHHHAGATQVIREFLHEHRSQAGEGRAFATRGATLHAAPPGSNACRPLPGWAADRRAGSARRRPTTMRWAAAARTSRSATTRQAPPPLS